MFKVMAIENKAEQERLCSVCSTQFITDSFAYATYDVESADDITGEIIAVCQFSFMGKTVIHALSPAPGREEDEAVLILGFAVLEFLRRCGFQSVTADKTAFTLHTALRLGFMSTGEEYTLDLTKGRACGGH